MKRSIVSTAVARRSRLLKLARESAEVGADAEDERKAAARKVAGVAGPGTSPCPENGLTRKAVAVVNEFRYKSSVFRIIL